MDIEEFPTRQKVNQLIIRKHRAYTLIELALVVLIVSIIYSTASPVYHKIVEEAKSATSSNEIQDISTDIDKFIKDNGYIPNSLEDVFGQVPLDPWGNPYQFLRIAGATGLGKLRKDKNLVPINSDYDLYSMGPDGKSVAPLTANASQDDIVRGRNGKFFGVATDY